MAAYDEIEITVLDDGTIKMETDKISPANHMAAERFLQAVIELAGGASERKKRGNVHAHSHAKQHKHHEH